MKRKWSKDDFVEKARVIHGDAYNYDKVIYENYRSEVEIICHKHGSFFCHQESTFLTEEDVQRVKLSCGKNFAFPKDTEISLQRREPFMEIDIHMTRSSTNPVQEKSKSYVHVMEVFS